MTFQSFRLVDAPSALASLHAEHLARRARMAPPRALLPPPLPAPTPYVRIPLLDVTRGGRAAAAVARRRGVVDDLMASAPFVPGLAHKPARPRVTTMQEILVAVCVFYSTSSYAIKSSKRTANIVLPRHIFVFLAKRLTTKSLPEIGRFLGGRDHTTVLHAFRRIERMAEHSPLLAGDLADLTVALAQS